MNETCENCVFIEFYQLKAEAERLKSFELQCFELDQKCTEYKRLYEQGIEIDGVVVSEYEFDFEGTFPVSYIGKRVKILIMEV